MICRSLPNGKGRLNGGEHYGVRYRSIELALVSRTFGLGVGVHMGSQSTWTKRYETLIHSKQYTHISEVSPRECFVADRTLVEFDLLRSISRRVTELRHYDLGEGHILPRRNFSVINKYDCMRAPRELIRT